MSSTINLSGEKVGVTAVFWAYWDFAHKRQEIFRRRIYGLEPIKYPIISQYRFTNPYRATDRVSQYLLQRVIYDQADRSPADTIFRTLLFKIFNQPQTWEILDQACGPLVLENFDGDRWASVLTAAMDSGVRIYNPAYIMPSPAYGASKKHSNHIALLADVFSMGLATDLIRAGSLADIYQILLSVPSLGPFLAYQYTIDINYGPHFGFSEMEFVVAGPGACRGISKCFSDRRDLNDQDLIRLIADNASEIFDILGLDFFDLWGRPLQLIDCQNIFCEIDKYARVAFPGALGIDGQTSDRPKQIYRPNQDPEFSLGFPPGWRLPFLATKPSPIPLSLPVGRSIAAISGDSG